MRRADWFEAFTIAVISGEERAVKPDRELYEVLLDVLSHETGGVSIPSAVIFFDSPPGERRRGARSRIDSAPVAAQRRGARRGRRARGAQIARRVLAERGVPLD